MRLKNNIFKTSPLLFVPILIGGMLGLAFPYPGIAGLGWLMPGILILASLHWKSMAQYFGFFVSADISFFKYTWLAGFSFWLVSLRWLLCIPFPMGAVLGWISLSAYLGIYIGIWGYLTCKLSMRLPLWKLSITSAAIWVILEWIRGHFLGGFAWNMLAVSQHDNLVLTQFASIAGEYGISFIMIAFSISWCIGVCNLILFLKKKYIHKTIESKCSVHIPTILFLKEGLFWLFIVAIIVSYGGYRLTHQQKTTEKTYSVCLIQPSIPQTLIWDKKENQKRFEKLIETSEKIIATNVIDLLVWPEAAIPGYIRYDFDISNRVSNLSQSKKVPIIFCSDDAEPDKFDEGKINYFNCAFFMDSNGELLERYKKQHLVIFGEYIPLLEYLPFLQYLTPISGNYEVGNEYTTFAWPSHDSPISPLICFEDSFPDEVRLHTMTQPCAFIYLANAGWFGESSAQWQHLANARFRNIENGIPGIRCCNNGITCWIDKYGNVHDIFLDNSSSVYGNGGYIIHIPIQSSKCRTFYQKYHLYFIYCYCLLILWGCCGYYIKKSKNHL